MDQAAEAVLDGIVGERPEDTDEEVRLEDVAEHVLPLLDPRRRRPEMADFVRIAAFEVGEVEVVLEQVLVGHAHRARRLVLVRALGEREEIADAREDLVAFFVRVFDVS